MKLHHALLQAIAGAALIASLSGCNDEKAEAAQAAPRPPAQVTVITAQPQDVPLTTELPGRTTAFRVAEVRPQVGGIVLKRLFEEGAEVKAGQQLYQIDPASYQAALDSARADLSKAQASVKSVSAKAKRYADLVAINAVSRQDYDDIVATLQADEADVAAAKAAVDTASINLEYTKVTAPISGRISRSEVTEGALVTASQATALATITQLDPIYVDMTQSSSDLLTMRRAISGGEVNGALASEAPVNLIIEGAGLRYGQPGKLQFSDVTVSESTGSVNLRAVFPNPEHELLPGMFVRGIVNQGVQQGAFVIPQQAVMRSPDGSAIVWVVGADSKVNPQPVIAARAIGDKWLVTSGLKAGDKVVTEGVLKIAPGAPVQAVDAAAPAATNVAATN
ncbi:efflux RND transporter periplasmic adaptor subunit [Radicibacter daui]|uniref:efflux RND transporter periplasmic adaptor subunit n=1 Tax=Radicibacter daui TaxID=3064829 RepID=UPI004046A19C